MMDTLEHKISMTPQHLAVIDAMLTMPGNTLEIKDRKERATICFL
jgi:hypothetical protein